MLTFLYRIIPVANLIKHIAIVNYGARVVLTTNLPIYNSRVVIYDRKLFIRLATGKCYSDKHCKKSLTSDQFPAHHDEQGFSKQLSMWFGMVLLAQYRPSIFFVSTSHQYVRCLTPYPHVSLH